MLELNNLILIIGIFVFSYVFVTYIQRKGKTYPPCPWGFPVVGHLPRFGRSLSKTFDEWRREYGDIFSIRMGSRQAVVINGYTLIKESLERKDDVFSDRPDFYTAEVLKKAFNGYHSIEFCPFNQLYIQRRKMMVRALHRFTHINIDYTHDLFQEEAVFMIDMFLSWKGAPHYIDEEMNATVGSILYQLLFGRGQRIREDILFQRIMRACDAYVNFTESGNPCEVCLFVCVEVLRPSQPNGVMSSAVSSPNHTFTGQA